MDYLPYLDQMKNIEKNILEFIDKENSNEEDFSKLSTLFSDQSNKHRVKEIKDFMYVSYFLFSADSDSLILAAGCNSRRIILSLGFEKPINWFFAQACLDVAKRTFAAA